MIDHNYTTSANNGNGAGAIQTGLALNLVGNTITNNTSGYIGGIHIYTTPNVIIGGNTFDSNHGVVGGALSLGDTNTVSGGPWMVSYNTLTNNIADIQSAALSIEGHDALVNFNRIADNHSNQNYGAAVFFVGNFTVLNNVITNNSAPNLCVAFDNATGTIANNLITGNTDGWAGTLYADNRPTSAHADY